MAAEIEDQQDWTPVVSNKRRDHSGDAERTRVRLEAFEDVTEEPKKRVSPETIQNLIRKRMELGINQERADQVCQFPRNTFRDIESHRAFPTSKQITVIQNVFGVAVRVVNHQPDVDSSI